MPDRGEERINSTRRTKLQLNTQRQTTLKCKLKRSRKWIGGLMWGRREGRKEGTTINTLLTNVPSTWVGSYLNRLMYRQTDGRMGPRNNNTSASFSPPPPPPPPPIFFFFLKTRGNNTGLLFICARQDRIRQDRMG